MLFKEFDDLVKRIFLFLGSDSPSDAQKQEWFEDVKRIPSGAIKAIWENLKQRDGISRRTNVPKVFNEIYAKISMANGGGRGDVMAYDPVEDFRFPVGLMHRALSVLDVSGDESFVYYCDSVRMPRNDRERVRNKLNSIRFGDLDRVGKSAEKNGDGGAICPKPAKGV
jgi:hypothetical protein